MKVISAMNVKYSYSLNGVRSENIINLIFFDFEKPYFDLISSIDYEMLTDYQRIWNTPYNDDFWEGQKLTFSKLDTLSDFKDMDLNSSNLLLRKRYLTIPEVRELGVSHFKHIPIMDDGARAMIKFDPIDMKTQRHVHANLFIQMYEINGDVKARFLPLIDHQRSFVLKETPMMDSLFHKELDVVEGIVSEANDKLLELDMSQPEKSYKSVRKLTEKYNKKIKNKLSELDSHQNRDWAATSPEQVRKAYRGIQRRN